MRLLRAIDSVACWAWAGGVVAVLLLTYYAPWDERGDWG